MSVINWILNQQIQLGMILCACLFVPWGQRRSCFVPRLAAGVGVFLVLTDTLTFLPLWAKLLLYTTLLFGLIWFSFDCSPLHALFYTTCAYAVQHIASKLAYMPIIWLIQHGHTDRRVTFIILLFSNLVVCLVIYRLPTLRIRRGRLLFDNVKTVLYSGFFLIAAVYLSVVIACLLRDLRNRLPAANQLHCRLLQTIFFDISVNRHAIDLLEQLLQMGHRHLVLCCQLGKRYIPLPVGQQMIPQMVCQLGLFRGKIGIRSGFLRNTIQEHEQFQRL